MENKPIPYFKFFNIQRKVIQDSREKIVFKSIDRYVDDTSNNFHLYVSILRIGQSTDKKDKNDNYFLRKDEFIKDIVCDNEKKTITPNFYSSVLHLNEVNDENNKLIKYHAKILLKNFISVCNLKDLIFTKDLEINNKYFSHIPNDDIHIIVSIFILFIRLKFNDTVFSYFFDFFSYFIYYSLEKKNPDKSNDILEEDIINTHLNEYNDTDKEDNNEIIKYLKIIPIWRYFSDFTSYNYNNNKN